MARNFIQHLLNPRLLAITGFGFASGLPAALVGPSLQAWFTEANMNLKAIGVLSLIGLPFSLKFLWAPLFDAMCPFGRDKRRAWLIMLQIALAAALFAMAQLQPNQHTTLMIALSICIAIFSASQDTVIDAHRTEILDENERGLGAAYYVFAYRIAMLVSGGFLLILADYVSFRFAYSMMAVLMLLTVICSLLTPTIAHEPRHAREFYSLLKAALQDFLQRDKIILLLLLVVFYKFGDALALQLMTNFLLHGLGFSLTEVGLAYKSVSFIATISGAFISGLLLTRWDIYNGLLLFGIAQAFSNLLFAMLAMVGHSLPLLTMTMFVENFCSGLSTAAFMAFLMSLCNRRFTATQYAMLSALASVGRVFLGPLASYLVEHLGWTQFYIFTVVLCFPGIIFLVLLKTEVKGYAHVESL